MKNIFKNNIKTKTGMMLIIVSLFFSLLLSSCDAIYIREKNIEPETYKTYDMGDDHTIKIEGDVKFSLPEKVFATISTESDTYSNVIDNCTILDIILKGNEKYFENSVINDGHALLYVVEDSDIKKNKTVTVNAGHGVVGGSKVKTLCHPDGSEKYDKVGENGEKIYKTYAITDGMTFPDGRTEKEEVLNIAIKTRDALLKEGYNVLMIREDNDSRLDNISRAILANYHSDMHISIHLDSTELDKGMFVIVPIKKEKYLNMEPVKSNYDNIIRFADAMNKAWRDDGMKMCNHGLNAQDLTQISYSTVPTLDIEVGDKNTDLSDENVEKMACAIVHGVNNYFIEE